MLAFAVLTFILVPGAPDAPRLGALGLSEGLVLLASILAGFLIGGVLSLASIDIAVGKRHAIGEYLRQALRHAGALIVLGVLVSLATAAAAVVLILPGLCVAARFLPYVPAIVFENAGRSGLGRAQALTEGYRWPLVGALLLLVLASVAISVPSILVSTMTGSEIVAILVETLAQSVIYCLSAIFSALVYLRVRAIKEGATQAEIAANFG